MVHTDTVVKDLEFSYEGVFDFKEVLGIIREYLDRNDYDVDETFYDTKVKGDVKTTVVKWESDKKADDYNKCFVKLKINLNDYKEGHVEGTKVVDGKFKLIVNAEVKRDYDEKWRKSPTKKFFRAVYEKYVTESKQSKVDSNLKNVATGLIEEMKQHFKV